MNDKVALYLRVSTEMQAATGHSLAAQEAVLTADATKRGKIIYKTYCDAGVSGVRNDRAGLRELLSDAKRGCFGEVLVWSISRLSRKLSHLLDTIEELREIGVEVRSVSEWFDSKTPVGQFCFAMMGAVGQMQRDSWTESLLLGMQARAKSGLHNGLRLLGYDSVPNSDDPQSGNRLVIAPEEADTVRQAFELYRQGFGLKAIVNRFAISGRKTKNGNSFDVASISRILHNPAYIGKIRFRDQLFDGNHEPIVALPVWDQVQTRLLQKAGKTQKIIDREYFLSGILRCPQCGSCMVPTHTKGRRKDGTFHITYYYACNANISKGSSSCRANSVPAGTVEAVVLKWLSDALSGPFWRRKIIETIHKRSDATTNPLLADRKQAEAMLEQWKNEERRLLLDYETGNLDKESFRQESLHLQSIKATLQSKFDAVAQEVPAVAKISPEQIRLAFRDLHKILKQASGTELKRLVHALVAKVTLDENRCVSGMELRFPLSQEEKGQVTTVSLNSIDCTNHV